MLRPLSPSLKASLEEATARYQSHVGQAEEYLAARGISRAIAETFRIGVVVDPAPGQERMVGRLAIPALGRDAAVYSLRFRSLDGVEPKYLGLPGVDLRLFNVQALHHAGESIHICEGELDTISLGVCGLPAVGVPGVKAWKPHHPRLFAGYSRVYVWGDGDSAGRDFAEKLARDIDSAVVVAMPDGMDVNTLLVHSGKESILSMAC